MISEGPAYTYNVAAFHLVKMASGVSDVFDSDSDTCSFGVHDTEWDFVYGRYPEHEELPWLCCSALFVGERVGFGCLVLGFHAFNSRGADSINCGELVQQFLAHSYSFSS